MSRIIEEAIERLRESLGSLVSHYHEIETAVNALSVDADVLAQSIHNLNSDIEELEKGLVTNVHDLKARMDFTSEVPSPDGSKDRDE